MLRFEHEYAAQRCNVGFLFVEASLTITSLIYLDMNINNFTIKAQEAIAAAQQLAFSNNNVNIETEHILKALLQDEDSAIDFLLKKNNVTMNLLESRLDENINKLPKV